MKKLILSIIFLMWAQGAWATYPNYTVCASGCDFTTITGAVSDIQTNHATLGSPTTITSTDATNDTATITLSSITTTSSNTLTITSSGSGFGNGKLGGHEIKPSTGNGINVEISNVIISNMSFDMSTSGGDAIETSSYPANIVMNNNFLKLTSGNGWGNTSMSGNVYFYNNICQGSYAANYSICAISSGGAISNNSNIYIYGNTAYGMGTGFSTDNGTNSTVLIYFSNNFSGYNYGPDGSVYRASRAYAGSNNICNDSSSCTTSPLTSGTNSATSYTSYFTSPSTGDFSLKTGSILIDGGATLGSPYNVDIIGTSRPQGSSYDVGAFEKIVSSVNHGFTRFLN